MTKEELQERMLRLDEEITEIRNQLERAKLLDGGGDPEWRIRASTALRHKGRERQRLQNQLGDLNRAIRAERKKQSDQDSDRAFIRAARAILPEDTYRRIWQEVERAVA